MKRTIQIGNKYKEMMEEYEAEFDKEEFNIFITKLLVMSRELKNRKIDILVIADLIKTYNIDFFSLIQGISNCANSNNIDTKNNNIQNADVPKEEVEYSPLIISEPKKKEVKKQKNEDIIDYKKEVNISEVDETIKKKSNQYDTNEVLPTTNHEDSNIIHKRDLDIVTDSIREEKKDTKTTSDLLFNNSLFDNEIVEENKNVNPINNITNPILNLGINLVG